MKTIHVPTSSIESIAVEFAEAKRRGEFPARREQIKESARFFLRRVEEQHLEGVLLDLADRVAERERAYRTGVRRKGATIIRAVERQLDPMLSYTLGQVLDAIRAAYPEIPVDDCQILAESVRR